MIYAYASLMEGVPFANGAPNLTVDIPAMHELSSENEAPICGKDFKTGQTLMKTVLAPAFKARMLGLSGWYLDEHPGQSRRRSAGRSRVVQDQGRVEARRARAHPAARISTPNCTGIFIHKVRINYYPPRGDNKEGWDNIDIFGWLGYPMQIKVDFLCRDSILAAPIVLDLVLFLDLAQRTSELKGLGIQEWLSFYFKRPMTAPGLVSGARSVHPIDEVEEHAAAFARRGIDYAPWAGVLRLGSRAYARNRGCVVPTGLAGGCGATQGLRPGLIYAAAARLQHGSPSFVRSAAWLEQRCPPPGPLGLSTDARTPPVRGLSTAPRTSPLRGLSSAAPLRRPLGLSTDARTPPVRGFSTAARHSPLRGLSSAAPHSGARLA